MTYVPILIDDQTQRVIKLAARVGGATLAEELQRQYGAGRFKDIPKDQHEAAVAHLEKVFGQ